jgi:hypothetical protein
MATTNLNGASRNGSPKKSGETPLSYETESPYPNNDIPTCFTTNHYKWLLKYQQFFQFYLVHGCTNVAHANADNSLAKWASYQRSKMGTVDKYDPKWKQLLYGIDFCFSPPHNPNEVFENHLASYNSVRGTPNAITPKKADNKVLHGWWKYWRQQGKQFMLGESRKIKDQDWHKFFVLYSAGIFSGISFEIQNGLPSRMYELSIIQGVPNSFQVATAKYPCNYQVNGSVQVSIQVSTATECPNEELLEGASINNSYPYQSNITPSSYEPEYMTYLKINPDPSRTTGRE